MRVLHVMPSVARAFGGPTESLLGYLGASRRAGIEAHVAAPQPPDEDIAWLATRAPGVPLHLFPLRGREPVHFSSALVRWLSRQRGAYDVVHVHGLLNLVSAGGMRAGHRAGAAVVVRPFGTLSRYTFAHRRGALKRLWLRAIDGPELRRAHAIHFTTDAERDEAEWHGLGLAERSHVVAPPWAGTDDATRRAPGTESAERTDAPTVLFLSRLHPKKGVEPLLDAWPAVVARHPGARLVIAGDGAPDYVSALRARAMQIGADAAASVEFAGFVAGEAKQRLFRAADLFVLPSHHENFGVAVLEAIAAGLPVVITPEVQLAPWVRSHALGAIVEREPAALARAIGDALDDALLRRRCRSEGAMLVARSFSPAAVGEQLAAMYEAAIERQSIHPDVETHAHPGHQRISR